MSIFKKAIDYLTGKKEEKEFQKKLTEGLEELLKKNIPQEFVIKQEDCKQNRLIYNVNQKSLTVISCNNDTFSGFNIEPEQLESFRNADNETIIRLLTPPKQEVLVEENIENQEKELVSNFLDIFEGVDDFEVTGNSVYFKGIKSVEIPSLIVARFVELIEKISYYKEQFFDDHAAFETEDTLQLTSLEQEYQSLKAFTLKLLLNPLEHSREQLLTFVRNNSVTITKNGNLVLYRACYEGKESNELVKFVAKEYLKIKAWKKSPKNFEVYDTAEGLKSTDKGEVYQDDYKGNLFDLYQKLPELQKNGKQYYSYHGRKKIVLGDIYKIEDSEVDLDASVCASGGLHAAAVNYDYSGFGDTNLIVLINPAKTITVPTYDFGKMRVSEMMIVGINPNERGTHISEDFYCDLDDNYHNYSVEELTHSLQTKSLESVSVSTAVAEVSLKDVQTIQQLLSKRVVHI